MCDLLHAVARQKYPGLLYHHYFHSLDFSELLAQQNAAKEGTLCTSCPRFLFIPPACPKLTGHHPARTPVEAKPLS